MWKYIFLNVNKYGSWNFTKDDVKIIVTKAFGVPNSNRQFEIQQ